MRSLMRRRLGVLAMLVLAVRVIFPEATHQCLMRASFAVSGATSDAAQTVVADQSSAHASHGASHQHPSGTTTVSSTVATDEGTPQHSPSENAPCDCAATCCCATPQWHTTTTAHVTIVITQPVESPLPRDHRLLAPYRSAHALPYATAPPAALLS